jgi:FkbM family methyltransferase
VIRYREQWGLWWPTYDANADGVYAYVMKRIQDADAALPFVKDFSCCVQAGGHVGTWPARLRKSFWRVISFEPEPECFAALELNAPGTECYPAALGAAPGEAILKTRSQSGSATLLDEETKPGDEWKAVSNRTPVRVVTIDSLNLAQCGLIVLDVEGHEVESLKGAAATIERCRPVIHVEELKASNGMTGKYLQSIGYKQRAKAHNDTIWTLR